MAYKDSTEESKAVVQFPFVPESPIKLQCHLYIVRTCVNGFWACVGTISLRCFWDLWEFIDRCTWPAVHLLLTSIWPASTGLCVLIDFCMGIQKPAWNKQKLIQKGTSEQTNSCKLKMASWIESECSYRMTVTSQSDQLSFCVANEIKLLKCYYSNASICLFFFSFHSWGPA